MSPSSRGEFLLLLASRARIADGIIASALALAAAFFGYGNTRNIAIAAAATLAVAFLADGRVRSSGVHMIGHDPVTPVTPVVQSAVVEAARAARMNPRSVFPRYLNDRQRGMQGAFAAAALNTQRGSLVFYGDSFRERALDVIRARASQGDQRFAFDELRAVLGHELAHLTPGAGASSRLLAIPFRFSMWFPWVLFWTHAAFENAKAAAAALAIVGLFKWLSVKNRNGKPVYAAVSFVTAVAVTIVNHGHIGLLVAYWLWPKFRPITAMYWQRRIETACDEVAIDNGADPYALSRFLERFEPEHARYMNIPFWQALHATHPPLRKRIVTLDSKSRTRR